MTDYHQTPALAVRVPVDLAAWARAEARRRGMSFSALVISLLAAEKARTEAEARES